jgi:methylase of polypeptide subunit release factors
VGTIHLNEGGTLELEIDRGVLGSDLMIPAIILARYLHKNKKLYTNKNVLDMGCGAGPQGIICAKNGAGNVDFSDISEKAVQNCRRNLSTFGIDANVYRGDLFESVPEKEYNLIMFNNPFFPEEAKNFEDDFLGDPILLKSLLGGTGLLKRFYREAKKYLESDGMIIQPYFDFAGEENNPGIQGPKHGYKVREMYHEQISVGSHQGRCSVFELR